MMGSVRSMDIKDWRTPYWSQGRARSQRHKHPLQRVYTPRPMTLQGKQGRGTHADELAQLSLTHPFPLPPCEDALTDMRPWGQVPSNNVQVERVEHCPERGQVALPVLQ